MAERTEFTFKSRDGKNDIHAVKWVPSDREPRAVLQIVHGMIEYVERYDLFASYMADQGFVVVGEDHLGHGHTAKTDEDLGYFTKHDAKTVIVRDVNRLRKITEEEYRGLPYFIYGFSMGSFIVRKYITMYGKGLAGVIIGGTGQRDRLTLDVGIAVCSIMALIKGDHYRSRFVQKMAFNGYLKKIDSPRTGSDWLCTDNNIVDAYRADKYCTFMFTLNAFKTMFSIIKYDGNAANVALVPKDLPIFIASGEDDPVGGYGKEVMKVFDFFKSQGIENVKVKLYNNMRHEIHNEKEKHIVFIDFLDWMEECI